MKYTPFHEQQFRQSVSAALKTVRKILDSERRPVLAENEMHEYKDKYLLTEFLTNTSVAAQMNVVTNLGLDVDQQTTVLNWVHQKKQSVTLRFLAEDSCTFLKEEEVEKMAPGGEHREVITTTKTENKSGGFFGGKSEKEESMTTRVIQRIKEYHWKVGVRYKILMYPGTSTDDGILLQERSTETVLVTQATPILRNGKRKGPLPDRTIHPPVDTDVTWFFKTIGDDQTCQFAIDRNHEKCQTPRRNEDVDKAVDVQKSLYNWSRITQGFFLQRIEKEILGKDNPVLARGPAAPGTGILQPGVTGIMQGLMKEPSFNGKRIRIVEYHPDQQRYKAEPVDPNSGLPPTLSIKPANIQPDKSQTTDGPALSTVTDDEIFCPVVPLMENGTVLPMSDVSDFLQEQTRSMDATLDNLSRVYPSKQLVKVVTVAEASLVVLCKHMEHLTVQFHDAIDYVEEMLKQQLIQAVGKEVGRSDFEQFMRFHNPRLFGAEFTPTPFSHAIRRPGHYPDGLVSIEATSSKEATALARRSKPSNNDSSSQPIETWVRSIAGGSAPSIYIPITASAAVEITGDRYLHGWMQHRFKSKEKVDYHLACRARQFSSFLVILGTVAGADKFEAKDAIILQNKDEVLIPLLTNVLPSAKEFKDAIQSLSPEQQTFAKAFRGMQLESSVFGVCVVQIKPQLEKLLRLPDGALTKEIQLTQDLMSLFVEYQVPSDLLTFDGAAETTQAEKVDAVKGYVKSVLDVIAESKKKQLKEEEMKADMRYEMHSTEQSVEPDGAAFTSLNEGSEASRGSARRRRMGGILGARGGGGGGGGAEQPPPAPMFKNQLGAVAAPMMAAPMSLSMASMAAPAPLQAEFDSYGIDNSQQKAQKVVSASPKSKKVAVRKERAPTSTSPNQPFKQQPQDSGQLGDFSPSSADGEDFTLIPKLLDAKLETLDSDNALRSTIIKAGSTWSRTRQENFLSGATVTSLNADAISTEKKNAFDLLDAISRSGTLPIDCAELHVFVAVSHCFENDVMGTVVQDNMNPIEKVERSSLMLASTIHGLPTNKLIKSEQDVQRLKDTFPLLFESDTNEAIEQG